MKCKKCGSEWHCAGNIQKCPFCLQDCTLPVEEKERVIEVTITLPASDMGKVIGKQGKIAKAMRTIVHAATPRNSKRYVVEIREKDGNAVDFGDENEENAD